MPDPAPQAPSLADLYTLLESLESAGVSLGLERNWREANAELTRLVAAGSSLDQAVELTGFGDAPTHHRLMTLLASGVPLAATLERLHAEASQQTKTQIKLTQGFAYPVLVALIAAAGTLLLGWLLLPLIESAYADIRRPPGAVLLWMLAVRDSAPVWLVVASSGLGVLAWYAYRAKPPRPTRQGVAIGPTARLRYASECHDAAALLETGVSPPARGPDAAPPTPLMAWALRGEASASDFRAIGEAYDSMSRGGSEAYAAWLPLGATILLGGGAVLLYSLALFAPVTELLWTLSF